VVALLLLLAALVLPDQPTGLNLGGLLRIPLEALAAVALVLVLPAKAGRIVAGIGGGLLGLVTILKVFDIGFYSVLERPFDPLGDFPFVAAGADYLRRSFGSAGSVGAEIGAAVLAAAVLGLMIWAALRVSRVVVRHHTGSVRTVVVLGVAWVVAAAFGAPLADRGTSLIAFDHVWQVGADIRDHGTFAAQMADDPYRAMPSSQLLTALRGKDVMLVYVESYGRVAIEDPEISPGVNAVLQTGYQQLKAAGFGARTAFLTSSTYAGGSWLAHATLESGVWVDSQQRYVDFTKGDRLTLDTAFARAGWRTVDLEPANIGDAPGDGSFQKVYDERDLGYRGERFTFNSMPDQYSLGVFQREERAAPHPPLMARAVLLSSHSPWKPIPQLLDWNNIGVGYGFQATQDTQGANWDLLASSGTEVKKDYGEAVQYSLSTLISYLKTYGDKNLVMVFLGDHQPAAVVTGATSNRDVPVVVVARDQSVLDRISGWGWQDGLHPSPQAPVWRMDTFRNRFLSAFGTPAA
jgi:hypothetical protein